MCFLPKWPQDIPAGLLELYLTVYHLQDQVCALPARLAYLDLFLGLLQKQAFSLPAGLLEYDISLIFLQDQACGSPSKASGIGPTSRS